MKANGQAKVQKLKAFPLTFLYSNNNRREEIYNEAQQKCNPEKSYFVLVFLETLTTLTVHFVATLYMYNVAKTTTGSLISATSLRE